MKTPFDYTPACVKRLIQAIVILSIVSISFHTALPTIQFLALTPLAITSWQIWQLITSLLIIPAADLSFSFFMDLFFAMAVLYTAGKTVVFAYGKRHFFTLYALGGIVSGITALITMKLTGTSYPFTEALPATLAVVIAWIMLIPYQNLFLYFVVPIKASWLFVIAFISTVLMNAAQGDYVRANSYLAAFIVGYLYSLAVLDLSGPFSSWRHTEAGIKKISGYLSMFWNWSIMKRLR